MRNISFHTFWLSLLVIIFTSDILFANNTNYFKKPLNIVVTFGKKGSTDRMARVMAKEISTEIGQPVNIINIKGDGTHPALEYFFSQKQDGYTLLCSSFPFYLVNNIHTKQTKYTLEDFSMINLQWFDYDFVVVRKDSKFNTIKEVLEQIEGNPKSLTGGVIFNSSGNLMLKLLRNKLQIKDKLNMRTYADEMDLRRALYKKEVDFIIISAKSSERYAKKLIKPLSIIKEYRTKKWDAPILNKDLLSYKIELPLLNGSMRGFAVSKEFKENYPHRYKYIVNIFRKILARKKVLSELRKERIGYIWMGPKKSNELIKKQVEYIKQTFNY